MTDELKGYLEKTKKNRENLKKLAERITGKLEKKCDTKKITFPTISPKRFKVFEEEINSELKSLFMPMTKITKFRSVSYNKRKISSIYLTEKPIKASFLPPLERIKEKLISHHKILKKAQNSISTEASPSVLSTLSSKIIKISSFEVNQSLLTPILKLKYSII